MTLQRIANSFLSTVLNKATWAVLITAGIFSTTVHAAEEIPGEYLVKYKDTALVSSLTIGAMGNVRILEHNRFGHLFKVKVAPANTEASLLALRSNPNVAYVVPNVRIHAFKSPLQSSAKSFRTQLAQSTKLRDQWAIKQVHAQEAWALAGNQGSRNVLVAVIDTGVDAKHESLQGNLVPGYDFYANTDTPDDVTSPGGNPGHGTHCSGIIGATGLVDGGTTGISPQVSIMPIRFLGADGSGDLNNAIKAVDYAVQKGAKVISASWGASIYKEGAQPLIDAVKRADDAGVIFVAAAANDGSDNDTTDVYPANAGFPNTIVVAASGPKDEKPDWSNYGTKNVHVAAPGLDIMSTLPGNTYDNLSGTSMATPLVAGMVAFLKAQSSDLTGAQIRALLQTTGAKADIKTACSCRVDALAATDALLKKTMFLTPAAASLAIGDTQKFVPMFGQAPYTFEVVSSSPAATVGDIAADGTFTAKAVGDVVIHVKDATGLSASSLAVHVVAAPAPADPDPNGSSN